MCASVAGTSAQSFYHKSGRSWDRFGNEIFKFGPTKKPNELQKKYAVDIGLYNFEGPRKPFYEMSDEARFRIVDTPVTHKALLASEQLWNQEHKSIDCHIQLKRSEATEQSQTAQSPQWPPRRKPTILNRNGRAYLDTFCTPDSSQRLNTFKRNALNFLSAK